MIVHLLETFEPGHAGYDAAWSETLQRHLAAIANGSATTEPWPTAHQQIAGDKMRDELGEALDVGIAELDRGQCIESSIDEFMAEIDAAVGLAPIANDPSCGKPRDDVRPGIRGHHIAQHRDPGQGAQQDLSDANTSTPDSGRILDEVLCRNRPCAPSAFL